MSNKLIKDVISSGRARGALKNHGITSIDGLRKANLTELLSLKGIGQTTIEEIQAIDRPVQVVEEDSFEGIEEGPHDVCIQSPNASQSIILLSGQRVAGPMGNKMIPGVYIQCESGNGKLSARMWFARKYDRDPRKIDEAIKQSEPWRADAVLWLKNRKRHGVDYHVVAE